MADNLTSIKNNKGEVFYVGDKVKFSNMGGLFTIMEIYIYEGITSNFPCWKAEDGKPYIPDNLILVERPKEDGWASM